LEEHDMKRAWAAIAATMTLGLPGPTADAGSKWKPRQKAKPAAATVDGTSGTSAAANYESGEQKVLEQILDEGPFTDLDDNDDGDVLSDLDGPGGGTSRTRLDRMKLEMPLDGGSESAVAGGKAGAKVGTQGRKPLEIQLSADDQHALEAREKRMQNAAAAAKKSKSAPAAAQIAATPGKAAPAGALTSNAPAMATVDTAEPNGIDAPRASRQRAAAAPQITRAGQPDHAAMALEVDAATGTSRPLAAAQKIAGGGARGKARQGAAPSAAELPETLFDTATAAAPGGKARRAPKAATTDDLDDPMPTQDPDTTADALAGMLSDTPSAEPDDDDELLAEAEAAAAGAKARPAPRAATADRYATAARKTGRGYRDSTVTTAGKTSAAGKAGKSQHARSKGRSKQQLAAADAPASASAPREASRASGSKARNRPAAVAAASAAAATARSDAAKGAAPASERNKREATALAATESPTSSDAPAQALALAEAATQPVAAAKHLTEVGRPDSLTARSGMSPGLIATLVGLALLVATGAGTLVWRKASASDDPDEVNSLA
jgi:hypothetical protein